MDREEDEIVIHVEDTPRGISWFPLTLCILCCIGFGIFLGLIVASTSGNRELVAAEAQTARLKADRDKVQELYDRAAADLAEANRNKEKVQGDLDAAECRLVELASQLEKAKEAASTPDSIHVDRDSTEPIRPRTWRTVKSWTISGKKTTETFQISSAWWRVRWESEGWALFGAYKAGGEIVGSGDDTRSSYSVIHDGPGSYYLEISGGNLDGAKATFFVEQPD